MPELDINGRLADEELAGDFLARESIGYVA
jgi:hypothetical protein